MAIYHLHAKIIGRSSGRSSVAAAAYRSGEKLHNEYDGTTHDYTRKTGVVYSEIILPENAPNEFNERGKLWNAVEKAEKRRDSQAAREVEVALPKELDLQDNIELLREYINDNYVCVGMCADFSIHDKEDGNPHAHIMLTTRKVTSAGFGGKNREWNDTNLLECWRENWAEVCNKKLKEKGFDERIDNRTLEEQGLDREPTIHVGRSEERKRENKEIIKRNERYTPSSIAKHMNELQGKYEDIDRSLQECAKKRIEIQRLEYNAKEMSKYAIEVKDQRAREYFKRLYHVAPEKADAEIQRLKKLADTLKRELGEMQEATLLEEKKAIELEYQKQKLLAEIRPDSKEILSHVKKPQPQLERIPNENYKKIMQEISPKQAQLLEERLKDDSVRRKIYERTR